MRRIALVTGHFPPSNLVAGERARLWSQYLPEFGWEPKVQLREGLTRTIAYFDGLLKEGDPLIVGR